MPDSREDASPAGSGGPAVKEQRGVRVPGFTATQLAEGVTVIEAVLEDCLQRRQWVSTLG